MYICVMICVQICYYDDDDDGDDMMTEDAAHHVHTLLVASYDACMRMLCVYIVRTYMRMRCMHLASSMIMYTCDARRSRRAYVSNQSNKVASCNSVHDAIDVRPSLRHRLIPY